MCQKYMNRYNFQYDKYKNGSVCPLRLLYEWGGVRGIQPHVHAKIQGKLPPPSLVV